MMGKVEKAVETTDDRLEAFWEFLRTVDERDTPASLAAMRSLRQLGFSVCVVSHQARRETSARTPAPRDAARPELSARLQEAMVGVLNEVSPLVSFEVLGLPRPHVISSDQGDLHSLCRERRTMIEMDDWKTSIFRAAMEAVKSQVAHYRFPYTGPVLAVFTFAAKPRIVDVPGESFWTCPVQPNGEVEDLSIPALNDLVKAAQSALEGTILANDVTVCEIVARKIYGPNPGAKIAIYPL